jgi:hypothetical protein
MQISHLLAALVLAGVTSPSTLAEEQASVHIKISPSNQLRGADEHAKIRWQGMQTCTVMDWYNFADFQYACQWDHGSVNGYNLYFMRPDGTVVYECACDNHLGSYDPWDLSVWTWTGADGVACYSRDGKTYDEVSPKFDNYGCGRHEKNCDTAKNSCAYFDYGGEYLDDDDDGGRKPSRS